MAEKKPNTLFYHDWYIAFSKMTDEDAGKLFKALMRFDIDGTEPEFEDGTVLDILFAQYSNAIYKNRLAYESTCKRRSKAAKEREAKKAHESTKDHNCADGGTKSRIVDDNDTEYESEYDSESVNDYEYDSDTDNKSDSKELYIGEFDVLWKRYPKKCGKQNAQKDYIKARKSGVDYDTISKGLDKYLEYIRVNKTEEKYIKHGSSWFHQHGWDDDYSTPKQESIMERLARL